MGKKIRLTFYKRLLRSSMFFFSFSFLGKSRQRLINTGCTVTMQQCDIHTRRPSLLQIVHDKSNMFSAQKLSEYNNLQLWKSTEVPTLTCYKEQCNSILNYLLTCMYMYVYIPLFDKFTNNVKGDNCE